MTILLAIVAVTAHASSFVPPPPVSEQLAASAAAGEYVVLSTTAVTLDDGFVVTHAEIEAVGTPVHGTVERATLLLPGGVVGDRFEEGFEGAPRVDAGETLFLVLQAHEDLYLVANGWPAGLFRKLDTPPGAVMVDIDGEVVQRVPCDARPVRAVAWPSAPANPDRDETGSPAPLVAGTTLVDDPLAVALPWDIAVAAFAACGGAR